METWIRSSLLHRRVGITGRRRTHPELVGVEHGARRGILLQFEQAKALKYVELGHLHRCKGNMLFKRQQGV